MNNLCVFQYSFQTDSFKAGKKKRESNAFFLFRNEMREKAPKNIKMTELNKLASKKWKKMSEDEKTIWKRRYEINRDRELPTNTSDTIDTTRSDNDNDNDKENLVKKDERTEIMDQDPPVTIKLESIDN